MRARTVLLFADQHVGWVEVERILTDLPDVQLIGTAFTAEEAERLAQAQQPGFIVATDWLDEAATISLLTAITQGSSPHSKVIVYAHECLPQFFFPGIQRWLIGYILRSTVTRKQLALALEVLLGGGLVLGSTPAIRAFATHPLC